jgi:hypothetical protein
MGSTCAATSWYIPDFAHWRGINDRLAFGTYNAMQAYASMLWHMREFSQRSPMQKESFLYAFSVKMKMQIKLFDMCFLRIRANHEPALLDVEHCCDGFMKTQAVAGELAERGIDISDRDGMYGNLTAVCAEKLAADTMAAMAAKLDFALLDVAPLATAPAPLDVAPLAAAPAPLDVAPLAAAPAPLDVAPLAVALPAGSKHWGFIHSEFISSFRIYIEGLGFRVASLGTVLVGSGGHADTVDAAAAVFALIALMLLVVLAAVRARAARRGGDNSAAKRMTRVGKVAWVFGCVGSLGVLVTSSSSL